MAWGYRCGACRAALISWSVGRTWRTRIGRAGGCVVNFVEFRHEKLVLPFARRGAGRFGFCLECGLRFRQGRLRRFIERLFTGGGGGFGSAQKIENLIAGNKHRVDFRHQLFFIASGL